MKELTDAISSRIKSPYLGYSVIAFIALNWRGIFLLSVTKGSPEERLLAFDGATSQLSLFAGPLLIGVTIAITGPWIQYAFRLISKKAFELTNISQLESEHKITIAKTKLEKSLTEDTAQKEQELIDRAKRDEQTLSIDDIKTRLHLQEQIVALRQQRDKLSNDINSKLGHPSIISGPYSSKNKKYTRSP